MEQEYETIIENINKKPLFYYDYLSDESCENIKTIVENNFFSNNNKESLIYYNPIKFKFSNNIELPLINNLKPKNEFNNKINQSIKKENLEIKKKIKHNSKSYNNIKIQSEENNNLFNKVNVLKNRKILLPKLKKKTPIDKFPIKYHSNYIDQVEKFFIKPYLNKDNIIYEEYIENKQSKIPFNFIM